MVFLMVRRGFSARDEPSWPETFIARRVRSLAVPARARNAENPLPSTPEVLADARGHFADHCAVCHANDGSGATTIGQNLYPKAPDMRQNDTQRLTDGELYYIIQNGIRLTGMPAWGSKDDERNEDSWKLVLFLRHLPDLTDDELAEMKGLNPKSLHDIEDEKRENEFLSGGADQPAPPHRH
jgi:mono/diheme cytochrome c family protein